MKRWQKLDRLALLAPLVLFLFLSIGKEGRLLWGIVLRERNFVVTIAALLLLLWPLSWLLCRLYLYGGPSAIP